MTKEEPTLYRRSIEGGYWVISLRVVSNFLVFVKSLIIANVFLLNDLGIISAAIMMMEVLSTFSQTGFESALIQKKGDVRDYLDTVWTAGVVKGVLLFAILYVFAPVLASFHIPDEKLTLAISVFRVMGLTFLIGGLMNVGTIYFQKELEFDKFFKWSLLSTLFDVFLSVTLVLFFRSLWGVVAARLLSSVISVAGSYYFSDYRPHLHFVPSRALELWRYGKWISGGNILGYILEVGPHFFVWFVLGVQPLALFRWAYQFATLPGGHISNVVSMITFPAYSKIQGDKARLRDAYLKVTMITAFLAFPIVFLIFVLSPDFVQLFLKEHLHPVLMPIKILTVVALITSVGSVAGSIFKASATVRPLFYFQWCRILLVAILIWPFSAAWGIVGTALAIAIMRAAVFLPGCMYMGRVLECSLARLFEPMLVPFLASAGMSLALWLVKIYVLAEASYVNFALLIMFGWAVYAMLVYVLDKRLRFGIIDFGLSQWKLILEKRRSLARIGKN